MAKCLIWGTPCVDAGSSDEFFFLDSPRAGGKYKLFGTAQRQVIELTPAEKKAVTSWIPVNGPSKEALCHVVMTARVAAPLDALTGISAATP